MRSCLPHLLSAVLLVVVLGLGWSDYAVAASPAHGGARSADEDLLANPNGRPVDVPPAQVPRRDATALPGAHPSGSTSGNTVVAPEPATLTLIGLGLASLGIARRRKQRP